MTSTNMHSKAFLEFLKSKQSSDGKSEVKSSSPSKSAVVTAGLAKGVELKQGVADQRGQESGESGSATSKVRLSRSQYKASKVPHEQALLDVLSNLDEDEDEGKLVGDSVLSDNGTDNWLKPVAPTYSLSTITAIKGMISTFGVNKVFTFPLTRFATLTTSGGGTQALSTYVYPSQFDQYNQLNALFEECKQVAVEAQVSLLYHGNISAGGGTLPVVMVANFEPSATSTTSAITTSSVNRLPGSKLISSEQTNFPVVLKCRLKNKQWTTLNASSQGSDPIGSSGRFNWVIMNTASATTSYFAYRIVATYQFRGLF